MSNPALSENEADGGQRKTKFPYLQRRTLIPSKNALKPGEVFADNPNLPNLDNLQGDAYPMFPKRFQTHMFFIISDFDQFRKDLDTYRPHVTSAKQAIEYIAEIDKNPGGKRDYVCSGIAFSRKGMNGLGHGDHLQDGCFDQGSMRNQKTTLGDMGVWNPVFDKANLHGVIFVTARLQETCKDAAIKFRNIFSKSIKDSDITIMEGRVRTEEKEHFGWRDGISQPALDGLIDPHPGQRVVNPGVIVMGYKGDPVFDNKKSVQRPDYTKDGTFLVFRKLEQDVFGFKAYVTKNYMSIPPQVPGGDDLTDKERHALFCARMFGRFKDGAPLALAPYRDNADYTHPDLINNFDYSEGPKDPPNCPFAAHVRKTQPRQLDPLVSRDYINASVMVRAGIPYGKDTTPEEQKEWDEAPPDNKPPSPRGLLFVCYQASIDNGFFRQSTAFANNDWFPTTDVVPQNHGQDPIIGGPQPTKTPADGTTDQLVPGQVILNLLDKNATKYQVAGFAKAVPTGATAYEQDFFVTSRGGEYFFVPSINTLKAWGASKNT